MKTSAKEKVLGMISQYEKDASRVRIDLEMRKKIVDGEEKWIYCIQRDNMCCAVSGEKQSLPLEYTSEDGFIDGVRAMIAKAKKEI